MNENNNKTNPGRIVGIVTENFPAFAYLFEQEHGFEAGDIISTCLTDPPPDSQIFVVNEIMNKHVLCVNKKIPEAMMKHVRKLTTVKELQAKVEANNQESLHETDVRERMRELFLKEKFTGTIEDRLLDGYLYNISQEDMSLSAAERARVRPFGQRAMVISTGKAGVLEYIKSRKRQGETEEAISKNIWIEMIIENVRLYVNIKNLKIINNEKKRGDGSHGSGESEDE